MEQHTLTVALAGNPNSGKTSIFNKLTGARQSVGNYPGITVDRKEGHFRWKGTSVRVIDLPGTYSLTAGSPEELIARNVILEEKPDLVINVIDASNLERNLYLTMQLMELGVNMVLAMNMWDVTERRRLKTDLEVLESILGLPAVKTVGSRGRGITRLKDAVLESRGVRTSSPWVKGASTPIKKAVNVLCAELECINKQHCQWKAIKLLEGDSVVESQEDESVVGFASQLASRLETTRGISSGMLIARARYKYIEQLVAQVVVKPVSTSMSRTDKIDAVVTNKYAGIPIFLVMMYLVFSFTFTLGEPLMGYMEQFFEFLGNAVYNLWPAGSDSMLRALLVEGVIGGVGGVLVFLPNIFLLFLAIALLEDSGYMARVAFIMDALMKKLGLHGKSFVPLLIGFGCTIPAILATRTLENRNDRFTTLMVAPLMSCGARFPIYMMIIPAFFPDAWRAPIVWLIYLFGILVAITAAKFLRKSVFKGEVTPFVMELPSYHLPTPVSILRHTWDRAGEYVKKAGTVILAISIVLWVLSSFPKKTEFSTDYDNQIAVLEASAIPTTEVITDSITALENARQAEVFTHTITGRLGKFFEPAMKPLGFDWRVTTALLAATAAKEVFVSQMGVVFAVGEADEDSSTLREKLRDNYTPLQGLAMMLFALISAPCVATIAATKKETESWKWAMIQLFGLTVLAYIITLIVYQVGKLVI
ncbi:MAG: ferrous iron transport protein B [Candidatus Sabulitectum sp.]|nr:ferrous iron transport protein B [Candidatus Sabulitectum sp.]